MKACLPLLWILAAMPAVAGNPSDWFGRWDLTLRGDSGEVGGWLEFTPSSLRIVPRVGGVKDVKQFRFRNGALAFSNVEWVGKWERVDYKLDLSGERVSGAAVRESGPMMNVTGVRAPSLNRTVTGWSHPVSLDWAAWKVMSPTKPGNWKVAEGVFTNTRGGPNLRTAGEFQDFRLDLEFNCPQGSNSGVILRGRYEIQIEEEPGNPGGVEGTGAVYQFLAPRVAVPRKPGEWRKLSITLVGRTVTVVLDGVTLIDRQEAPGPTSGGFNSHEEEPGPIILQGDHGPISYRNIVLTPAETR
jgi:3-keto-disaccharide hydrolase